MGLWDDYKSTMRSPLIPTAGEAYDSYKGVMRSPRLPAGQDLIVPPVEEEEFPPVTSTYQDATMDPGGVERNTVQQEQPSAWDGMVDTLSALNPVTQGLNALSNPDSLQALGKLNPVTYGMDALTNMGQAEMGAVAELPRPHPQSPAGRLLSGAGGGLKAAGGFNPMEAVRGMGHRLFGDPSVDQYGEPSFSDVAGGGSTAAVPGSPQTAAAAGAEPGPAAAPSSSRMSGVRSGSSTTGDRYGGGGGSAAPPREAEAPLTQFKAVRLPDGRVIFTNQSGYAGHEMDAGQAAQAQRQAFNAGDGGKSSDRVMQSIVRNAARAGQELSPLGLRGRELEQARTGGAEPESVGGRQVGGSRKFPAPGAGNQGGDPMRGSMAMEREYAMEDVAGQIGMERANTELERSRMTPEERFVSEDPEILRNKAMSEQFAPQGAKDLQDVENKLRVISEPTINGQPNPAYIADPQARRQKERSIRQGSEAKQRLNEVLLSVLAGLRPPNTQ